MASEKSGRTKLHLQHAPTEIERKFLVANNMWRSSVVRSVHIRDGLIAAYKDRKVRVRISGDVATIAIKGPRRGIARVEYEYEIPGAQAEAMLSICGDDTLKKQRFFVDYAGYTWQVDVYGGILDGVVIAEIEFNQEAQDGLVLPPWIGKEITGDASYRKINMLTRRRELKAAHTKLL